MQGGADELVSGEEQLLEFEDQLQQIEMLVNLKKVADRCWAMPKRLCTTHRKRWTKRNLPMKSTPSCGMPCRRRRMLTTTSAAS